MFIFVLVTHDLHDEMFFFHLNHFFLRMTVQLVERTIYLATLFLALEVKQNYSNKRFVSANFSNVGKTTLCHYLPNNTKNNVFSLRLFLVVVKKNNTLRCRVRLFFKKLGQNRTPRYWRFKKHCRLELNDT